MARSEEVVSDATGLLGGTWDDLVKIVAVGVEAPSGYRPLATIRGSGRWDHVP